MRLYTTQDCFTSITSRNDCYTSTRALSKSNNTKENDTLYGIENEAQIGRHISNVIEDDTHDDEMLKVSKTATKQIDKIRREKVA